jgi:hypothetical protein
VEGILSFPIYGGRKIWITGLCDIANSSLWVSLSDPVQVESLGSLPPRSTESLLRGAALNPPHIVVEFKKRVTILSGYITQFHHQLRSPSSPHASIVIRAPPPYWGSPLDVERIRKIAITPYKSIGEQGALMTTLTCRAGRSQPERKLNEQPLLELTDATIRRCCNWKVYRISHSTMI